MPISCFLEPSEIYPLNSKYDVPLITFQLHVLAVFYVHRNTTKFRVFCLISLSAICYFTQVIELYGD